MCGQDGGCLVAFDALICHFGRSIGGAQPGLGEGSTPENAEYIQNDQQGKKDPDCAFEFPPAALEFEIGPDSEFVVYLRYRIPDRRCWWGGGWHGSEPISPLLRERC